VWIPWSSWWSLKAKVRSLAAALADFVASSIGDSAATTLAAKSSWCEVSWITDFSVQEFAEQIEGKNPSSWSIMNKMMFWLSCISSDDSMPGKSSWSDQIIFYRKPVNCLQKHPTIYVLLKIIYKATTMEKAIVASCKALIVLVYVILMVRDFNIFLNFSVYVPLYVILQKTMCAKSSVTECAVRYSSRYSHLQWCSRDHL